MGQSPGQDVTKHRRPAHQIIILEDHANLRPHPAQGSIADGADHFHPANRQAARSGRDQPVDTANQCRFTGSRQTNHHDKFTGAKGQADILESLIAVRIGD